MRHSIICILSVTAALQCSADVFLTSDNSLKFISVPTNQTLYISAVRQGGFVDWHSDSQLLGLVVQNGVTNIIQFPGLGGGPYAITGACQVAITTFWYDTNYPIAALISYSLVQGNALHSSFIPPGGLFTLNVPAGKTVRFLTPSFEDASISPNFTFSDGTNTIYDVGVSNGDEFAGPITISKPWYAGEQFSQLISYYFTDDFFVVPPSGFLSGPTGSFEIVVDKSVDSTNWYPAVVNRTSSDQKAFYRLRIGK